MLFNSISFLLFFPVVCALYYSIPAERLQARNVLLLTASYYFYMSWQPAYALLLLTSTVVTWAAALAMERTARRCCRLRWLVACIVLNLGILFLFKYYNFLGSSLSDLLQACRVQLSVPRFGLLLPVGISFYTFQALGYSVDVYRGTVQAERNFLVYALFVSFFPQLVAGPIERSAHLLPQFHRHHTVDFERIVSGIRMMIWGYFLKLVVADRCAICVDTVFNSLSDQDGGTCLIATLLFPFQIYGDFAGYSLIAIGTARVLGFRLMQNFRSPYLSCSVGEFWHRWHISLSTWFRDYVYIPLGGNRTGRQRQYLNLLLTFTVSGLWHGANWTFVCWGLMHGVVLCVEKAFGIGRHQYAGVWRLLHWAVTFCFVCLAWVMFRAATVADAFTVYTAIFSSLCLPSISFAMFTEVCLSVVVVGAMAVLELAGGDRPAVRPVSSDSGLQLCRQCCMVGLLAVLLLFGVLGGDQFIYFQF